MSETREQFWERVKGAWPDAKFTPMDEPPVGRLVHRREATGFAARPFRVIGRASPQKPQHQCSTCSCPDDTQMRDQGWWELEDTESTYHGKPARILEFCAALE